MKRRPTEAQLPVALRALGEAEGSSATSALTAALGGDPVAVRERTVGEPAYRSRRQSFASGGQIILHDEVVAAVILNLEPTLSAPRGIDLADWVAGITNDATLDDLTTALTSKPHFAGLGTPYFTLDGGYARATFRDDRGWNHQGNLIRMTLTAGKPGLACRPEDDDCPTCSDLLVRPVGSHAGIDVDSTVDALAAVLAAGRLTENPRWVRLADLQALHASRLMERVESQLTCTTCRRIICLTLIRDASPTFGHHVLNDATRRPLEAIPPVDQWGDASRIAAERDAMHYVDHRRGSWFLVEQQGVLYLDARYSHGAAIDDSALIRLDDAELAAYRAGGRDYVSELATRIHHSAPYREESPFHERDLYRGPDGARYRTAVGAAIVNHTWIAEQRKRPQRDAPS